MSMNLELVDLVFPSGPDTRPAMDEDESLLRLWVHIDVVYRDGTVSERGAVFLRLKLTEFNSHCLIRGAVHG